MKVVACIIKYGVIRKPLQAIFHVDIREGGGGGGGGGGEGWFDLNACWICRQSLINMYKILKRNTPLISFGPTLMSS